MPLIITSFLKTDFRFNFFAHKFFTSMKAHLLSADTRSFQIINLFCKTSPAYAQLRHQQFKCGATANYRWCRFVQPKLFVFISIKRHMRAEGHCTLWALGGRAIGMKCGVSVAAATVGACITQCTLFFACRSLRECVCVCVNRVVVRATGEN